MADCIEADEDARESHVMGLDTEGLRDLPLLLGLVGGETERIVGETWETGMGLEMEGCCRVWWVREEVNIVQGGRRAQGGRVWRRRWWQGEKMGGRGRDIRMGI